MTSDVVHACRCSHLLMLYQHNYTMPVLINIPIYSSKTIKQFAMKPWPLPAKQPPKWWQNPSLPSSPNVTSAHSKIIISYISSTDNHGLQWSMKTTKYSPSTCTKNNSPDTGPACRLATQQGSAWPSKENQLAMQIAAKLTSHNIIPFTAQVTRSESRDQRGVWTRLSGLVCPDSSVRTHSINLLSTKTWISDVLQNANLTCGMHSKPVM